jgi:trans-aconitate methyltransferase
VSRETESKTKRKVREFDQAFFERFYGNPATRVADAEQATRLVDLIAGVVGYLELPVRRILDAGCGVGLLREPLLARFPKANYEGLELSAYLCERLGWHQGSIADFETTRPYDLVICHDVLQYLDDKAAAKAIQNLARLSAGALYLSVLTERDWRVSADQSRTDQDVQRRSLEWYQRRLRRGFRHVAAGVHVVRSLHPILWELEQPWV